MLRHPHPPDAIFTALLLDAVDYMIDSITPLASLGETPEAVEEEWRGSYPLSAGLFSMSLARETLKRLRTAILAPEVYQATDYHWLLLYDALEFHCTVFNDTSSPEEPGEVGPYLIGAIDFDLLLSLFFWDLDFLVEPDYLEAIGEKGRQMLGVNPELFGLAHGLAPHAAELDLIPYAAPEYDAVSPGPPPGTVIPKYPMYLEDDEPREFSPQLDSEEVGATTAETSLINSLDLPPHSVGPRGKRHGGLSMKRLTVIMAERYRVPGSYRVVDHPVDGIECLEIQGRHYLPAIHWLEFRVDPENPPHGAWVQDNGVSEVIGSRMDSEEHEMTLVDAP